MRCQLSRLALPAVLFWAQPGSAEPLAVGVVAPLSGPSAFLGRQIEAGARAAAAQAGSARIRLLVADDGCAADGGRRAAQRLAGAKVRAVVGFLCGESIAAAMPVLAAARIPAIAVGVRADSLTDDREKTGWTVARLGPRADAEREAAARLLPERWERAPFAIVDDGTIYGRELAGSVRDAAEAAGLKPAFVDTFRPGSETQAALGERLAKAGVAELFVGGDRGDAAVIARDAKARAPRLTVAGGEALRDEPGGVGLLPGTLMIGLPDPAETAAPEALAAVRAEGAEPEGYALPAFAAVQIVEKALAGTRRQAEGPFDGRTFGTAVGPVSFDGKGDLAESPFRLLRFDGRRFAPVDAP